MATVQIKIDNIWAGESNSQYFLAPGQYLAGIGVDPDLPISDSVGDRKTSGVIRPSSYAKFSGSNVTANPIAIITTPKDTNIYVVLANGRLLSYSSTFGSETLIGTVSGGVANGAWYHDNYIYISTTTDISRYGPLNNSPTLTDTVWTGGTLGTQSGLVNTTYPSLRGGGTMPNHWGFFHIGDGKSYVLDFDSTSSSATLRGHGLIHFIQTKYGSAQGDTNNNSTYNALDLPSDYMPTCACSYGNDIVIGAIKTSNATLTQGKAKLFFWNTLDSSWYNAVDLPDSIVTAVINNNGVLYAFSGAVSNGSDVSNGYRLSAYLGGQTLKQIHYSNTGHSPLPGAVEAVGNRIYWGTFEQINTTTASAPTYYAVVKALGSKHADITSGVHTVARATATATAGDGLVTSLKVVQQSSFSYPKFVIGWRDSTSFGLDSQSTTYGTSVWRYPVNIGQKFIIRKIRVPLGTAVAANMTLTPKIFLDDFSSSSTSNLTVINNTNYANSERYAVFYPDISGINNFTFELTFSGSALLPVILPLLIDVELIGD